MSAVAAQSRQAVVVRDARPGDSPALVALAAACPMAGDIEMCVDRRPDFFALSRIEGDRWRVGVAETDDAASATEIVGCVAASQRLAYVDGQPQCTTYASDFKVHPAHRGGPAADALGEFVREACRDLSGDDALSLVTVLSGNRSMERRSVGPRGLPALSPIATIDVHAVPFLHARAAQVNGLHVSHARDEDIDEMAALWSELAPGRQLAPVLDAERLARWIRHAPGLAVYDYLVARRANGRIGGFIALWDQRSFKQLRVLGYSARLTAVRLAMNAVAPMLGSPRLPAAGGTLPSLGTVHLCAPAEEPAVLRALLLHGYAEQRRSGHLFFTVALDRRDPLARALGGLFAQPTAVCAYATTPAGRWTGGPLDRRPLHFESALV